MNVKAQGNLEKCCRLHNTVSTWNDWLTHWLTEWPTHSLTHWPTDWLTDRLTHSLTHWLSDSLIHWQTDWLTHTDWSIDWPTDLLTHSLTDRQVGWLSHSINHSLTNRLTDWLNDWLNSLSRSRIEGSSPQTKASHHVLNIPRTASSQFYIYIFPLSHPSYIPCLSFFQISLSKIVKWPERTTKFLVI
jgi:hypothetical protein